jgi:hypothetical protein
MKVTDQNCLQVLTSVPSPSSSSLKEILNYTCKVFLRVALHARAIWPLNIWEKGELAVTEKKA